jgi:hypothetical protein
MLGEDEQMTTASARRKPQDHPAALAAYLNLKPGLTSTWLRELAPMFGLSHADSVRNLTRRVDRALAESGKL